MFRYSLLPQLVGLVAAVVLIAVGVALRVVIVSLVR